AAHARNIQPGQVRNGQLVHSVNHWNGNNWNNNWNNNWHHHNNFFFGFGFFPWFGWGGWPGGFFWPWWGGGLDYGYWNYPRYYYSDNWVMPPSYAQAPQQPVQNNSANLEVLLPDPNAQLQIDGHVMTTTGAVRYFASPPLAPGDYSYRVTAT